MRSKALPITDYNPYYQTYIDKLGDVELMDMMQRQLDNFPEFILSLPKDKWNFAYSDNKWTIAEVILHVLDTERIFQYRALRFGRNDSTAIPGFDQDVYVPESNANSRSIESIVEEYRSVRNSSITLFASFDEGILKRSGMANGSNMSVAALGFIILGHQRHHRDVIRSRYL
ncbi:MAG: DinB family protein [Flavobacteriales bacterium]|nr:MAG: DinB family protein [Flavobacteriales bacterium]